MKLMKKLEDIFAAGAMAEAGEFDAAREMIRDDERHAAEIKRPDLFGDSDSYNDLTTPPVRA